MPDLTAQHELKKKDLVVGKVVKTSLAGAVVDLGSGKLGVVPISQLGNETVRNVAELLKEGEEVTAWIRRIDNSGRIELTLVKPLAYEWRDIKPEMTVNGKVIKLEKFGAFVDIGAESLGLVHISEMAREYVKSPDEKVKVGDEIQAKVLEVDRRKKQIKLSMKALLPQPEPKRRPKKQPVVKELVDEPEQLAPTAMEVALKRAMGQENENGPMVEKPKRMKDHSEMEEILSRTLENRVRSK